MHGLLMRHEVDPRALDDFRDALNRVRNSAWAAQQAAANKALGKGPCDMDALLASERVRAAYSLCRLIGEDLTGGEVQFQRGQLNELFGVVAALSKQLKREVR